jgi:hypothetical protein
VGGLADTIIGTTLGAGSLIGMSYVVSQIAARLFRNPPKLPPIEAYGDWIEVPAEGKYAPENPERAGGRLYVAPRRKTQHDGEAK